MNLDHSQHVHELIQSLSAAERAAIRRAHRRSLILPAYLPRKFGPRLQEMGLAVSYEASGLFRAYQVFSLSLRGRDVAVELARPGAQNDR